jgi:hypothetical protein
VGADHLLRNINPQDGSLQWSCSMGIRSVFPSMRPNRINLLKTKKPDALLRVGLWKLAPRVGFEPTTDRLTADCSTTELPRIKEGLIPNPPEECDPENHVFSKSRKLYAKARKHSHNETCFWRHGAESNRCTRLCRPLHNHSATAPLKH